MSVTTQASLTPMQTVSRMMSVGLAIASASTPSLNGTYAIEGFPFTAMQAEIIAILLSGATPAFADGTQALNWPDVRDVGHTFTPAQFHNLFVAVAAFLVQCEQYAAGLTTTQPTASATIA